MRDLVQLKSEVLAYCERRKTNGGNVAEYKAPCCGKALMTGAPNDDDVWDSLVQCYECGERHFVVKKSDGVVATKV